MNIPATTQILNEIERRLAGISEANGYFTNDITIARASLKPFNLADLPAINYWNVADLLIEAHGTKERRQLEILIEFYDRENDMPLVDKSALMASDLSIALNRNPDQPDRISPKLGGLAFSVSMESITPAIGEGQAPYCGTVITLQVQYRVDWLYPFTLLS